jgi:hypothetical protein
MKLKKSGYNPYAKFNYYELSDFLPFVNEIFADLKLSDVLNVNKESASLKIINSENPNESVLFEIPISVSEMKGCTNTQALGAAITYAKRYLYQNALDIVENDVLDAKAGTDRSLTDRSLTVNEENSIEKISNIQDLNKIYMNLSVLPPATDESWKRKLKQKSDALGAVFNKASNRFELAARKLTNSDALAAAIA